ncbi:cobalamin biosynthesis protein [Thiocapsa marina]|uniref:Cobalamin (Vitamin B12) biosynthesis CbiG protein n=1 Tax=Thiocapsa marina 5811 TaxID=768671 RepID=F9UA44_9GAMM|nr:cobalamin biosynthesis protein [Thiocapsa marina]EGV18992.1 cobalamin (vitamin B12) biosynthesis CbiG protein [Thiocapsa marina 5811]
MIEVALGIGCDRGAAPATLKAALDQATAGLGPLQICCIASIDRKGDEPAILALADALRVPFRLFTAEALSGVSVPNPSRTVQRIMGTPSVSEAAALLASGASALLLPKYRYRGADGKHATVALALWIR